MKNKAFLKKLILICFSILFILLIIMCVLLYKVQEKNETNIGFSVPEKQDLENDVYNNNQVFHNVKEILESYDCTYISEQEEPTTVIYLVFGKSLFNSDGSNNRNYYESLINALAKKLIKKNFYLYDEKNSIQINVSCDFENDNISYKINNISNYFGTTNGDLYQEIENTEIAQYQYIPISYNVLYNIVQNNMYLIDELGEPEGEVGKYKLYQNGTIMSRNFSGKVRNMIFLEGYDGNVFTGVEVGTPLSEIKKLYPNNAFGSIEEGYLGYRTAELYVFFYENQISVYGYSYYEQKNFEDILEEYLNTNDLNRFTERVTKLWTNYDEFEYDSGNKSLYLTYPSIGVIINIQNNNSKGITICNNYYLSDKIKNFIIENKISLDSSIDALYMSERNRINKT